MKPHEVLTYLRPDGGWIAKGTEFAGIEFIECDPVTEKEYNDAIKILQNMENNKTLNKESAIGKLIDLGLTEEEIAAL